MDEDKWIRDKAAQEDGAMANAGRLQPTSSQQAALEQAAREWLIANEYGCWRGDELLISPEDVRRLSLLLAAQRAAGLEAAAEHWTQVGVKRAELYDALASKAMIEMGKIRNEETANFVAWLYKQAKEQRP